MLEEIHPGEILREEFMAPLRLSNATLMTALDVPNAELAALMTESGPITVNLARALAAYFKNSEEFWLNLQAGYDARTGSGGGRQ